MAKGTAGKCAGCEKSVSTSDNWLRAKFSGAEVLYHYACFTALLRQAGELAVERAAWQAERRVH